MKHTTLRNEQQAVAEARVRDLSKLAHDLLHQIDGTDPTKDELLRSEATRLSAVSFEIVRALCRDNPEKAYRICCGNDVDRTSLGMTA